jgi:probable rRNA maturation factor
MVMGSSGAIADVSMRRRVATRLRIALRALGRARSSVNVVYTGDREIRALNRDYRKIDRATDVLSFHLQELDGQSDPSGDGIPLGDIVISVQTALRRAGLRRLAHELECLAVHGLCHLFGHDHKRPAQAKVMFALERQLRRQPMTTLARRPLKIRRRAATTRT